MVARMISQRELRNSSAAALDAVFEAGETIFITRDGHTVAELRPIQRRRFAPTSDVIRALRGLPRIDIQSMRAEADQLFGPDRIDE